MGDSQRAETGSPPSISSKVGAVRTAHSDTLLEMRRDCSCSYAQQSWHQFLEFVSVCQQGPVQGRTKRNRASFEEEMDARAHLLGLSALSLSMKLLRNYLV
jgi:hypothetical protein